MLRSPKTVLRIHGDLKLVRVWHAQLHQAAHLFVDALGFVQVTGDVVLRLEVSADDASKAGKASGVRKLNSGRGEEVSRAGSSKALVARIDWLC